jgi:sugar lactone lactonase YvrE
MDRQTKAIYKRGAIIVLPILAIVGCRVGLRACVAIQRSERNDAINHAVAKQAEAEREAELAVAAATSEATQRARTRLVPTAARGSRAVPIASAQQVPDALAVDAHHVAWLATRSGDVVVASRDGGGAGAGPRIVAKDQKLPQRRHVQGLALAGGYVYWMTSSPPRADEEDGEILRVDLTKPAAEPEVVASGLGGLSALLVDKDSVYYARGLRVSRDEDGGATGGVYRLELGPKGSLAKPTRPAKLLVAAERPCAIAVDETSVYAVEPLKLWRVPKARGEAKAIVNGGDRLGCTVATDSESVYWTIPGDDSVMRAKKTDGTGVGVVAFTRKRPTNVVVDQGYAYVLTETSPQALGELGSIFKVALRSERLTPQALITDQVGLGSVAASGGYVVFSGYNESESDGTVVALTAE